MRCFILQNIDICKGKEGGGAKSVSSLLHSIGQGAQSQDVLQIITIVLKFSRGFPILYQNGLPVLEQAMDT